MGLADFLINNQTRLNMNREEHLQKTFPLEDGTTYIQSIDESFTCEYSGLPSPQSYEKNNEPKGAGAGGKVEKGNFIDSIPTQKKRRLNQLEGRKNGDNEIVHNIQRKSLINFMYDWIREKSGK
jgi:hypothetical protein